MKRQFKFIVVTTAMLFGAATSMARAEIPWFHGVLNQASDNAAGYLINHDGGDDTTIDKWDRLRGFWRFETIENLSNDERVFLTSPDQPTELTAVYDVTVASKDCAKHSTSGDETSPCIEWEITFAATLNADLGPGLVPAGTVLRFYEDSAKDYTRLLGEGEEDDGDENLIGADLGSGPFATEEQLGTSATGGEAYWDFGFSGASSGEGWVYTGPEDVLNDIRNTTPPSIVAKSNFGLTLLNNYSGPLLGQVDSLDFGPTDLNGSFSFLGVSGVNTPYDHFGNVDVTLMPLGAALGDYLWEDRNQNGIQDEPADAGINGQNVFLLDCDLSQVAVTVTADDAAGNPGYYLFDNLAPGCYVVEFTKPAGFVFTDPNVGDDALDSDADPGTGRTDPITLLSGDEDLTWDAGVYLPLEPKLGDYVWEDLNGDGEQDPNEPGINGATVELYDCAGNFITSTLTANDINGNPGYYLFESPDVVVGGCYQVQFIEPVNYCEGVVFTERQAAGIDPALDSDAPLSDPVSLTSANPVDLTVDAGVLCPAALGDYVWQDLDRNGIQDDGETGINGVTVQLLDCEGTVLQATTTFSGGPNDQSADQNGYYEFTGLLPGCYAVGFTAPADFVFTDPNVGDDALDSDADPGTGETGPIDLASGETNPTIDAGVYEPIEPQLGDYVWEDLNADGEQDPNEPGINGATVNLYDCTGTLIATTTTAADAGGNPGYYLFESPDVVVGGCYEVQFIEPVAYCEDAVFTERQAPGVAPALDSDAPQSDQVSLTSANPVDLTIDAGVLCPAGLGDYVWEDLNRDGIQNEPESAGVNGVTVDLLDPGPDGLCDTGDEFLADTAPTPNTTVTADDLAGNPGYYQFFPLDAGSFCVRVVKPDGFECTLPNEGPLQPSPIDSDVIPTAPSVATCQTKDPVEDPIELSSGEFDSSWDAGIYAPAELGDYIWNDLNANGIQDDGETGINGVTVRLQSCEGVELQTTTTFAGGPNDQSADVNGYYEFTELAPGCYQVTFDTPAGFVVSPRQQGTDPALDSDGTLSDPVTLVSGERNATIDAGFYQSGSLGDYVWNDLNADGIQNDGETGINGVTVKLLSCEGVELETTTTFDGGPNDQSDDPNGFYEFTGLEPGCYKVAFDSPAGFLVSPRQQGTDPALDSDGTLSDEVTLVSGERNATIDAGFFQPRAGLGDYVWEDLNADGIQNDGNTGINGVNVQLLNCTTGAVLDTTTTSAGGPNDQSGDVNGYYQFTGLVPGCYQVAFVNPDPIGDDAYQFSPRQQGGNPALDSDGPLSDQVVLAPGEFNPTIDTGLYRLGSIHVFGFLDVDGDGIQDSDEDAFPDDPGKTFELLDADGAVINTQITVSGEAGFVALLPGTYTVRENPIPDGYSLTTLPNERTYTIVSGEELVYEPGAADLPQDDQRFETNLRDELKWGNVELAALGDYVWEDLDADGIQDDGNEGINGVTVRLLSCAGVELRTTVTGAGGPNDQSADVNGYYEFTGLLPGCYQVAFVNPDPIGDDAYQFSPRQVGANPALDSDGPVSNPINLIAGERNPTIDAGLYRLGSIHVFGFLDIDGDGIQDSGEGAFPDDPGKTFVLVGPGDTQTQTTVRGEAGFVSLLPGTYTVRENPIPDGYSLTTLPNERSYTIVSGQELVYQPGAADLPQDDQRFETVLGDELKWGNTLNPVCDVVVEKTCAILPPQVSEGTCEKPIDVLTLEYAAIQTGGKLIDSVDWYAGDVGSTLIGTTGAIADGEVFDFSGFDGSPNDVQMLITFDDGSQVISEFHRSCSDPQMDGPEDCGTLEGDGKSNDLSEGNIWLFRGTDGPNGGITCALPITDPVFPTEPLLCEYTAEPEAAICDDVKPIDGLVMQWNGEVNVDIIAYDGDVGDAVLAEFEDVSPGEYVTVTGMDGSPNDQQWAIFEHAPGDALGAPVGTSEFHISCSDDDMDGLEDCPLPQGDGKSNDPDLINQWGFGGMIGETGSLFCPGVPGGSDSVDVIYGYRVTNPNAEEIIAQISDVKLGISQTEPIAANDFLEIVVGPVSVLPDEGDDGNLFVNTVVVTAETGSGASCDASDSVTVQRNEPLVPVACSDIDPITAVSLVWDGDVAVDIVMESGEEFKNVLPGNQITFQEADTGNDVLMDIYLAGTTQLLGSSEFHVSCSDDNMNGTEDCGTNQGNGKGDDGSLINDWLFDGMTGVSGSFACELPSTGVVDPAPLFIEGAEVADLKDLKKVKWDLTNNTFEDAYITNLYINWPAAHDQLKKVKLGGDEFAKDVFDGTPPTNLPAEDPFEDDIKKRTLPAGATETLEIEFTVEVPFRELSDFEIVVEFSNGQTVTFTPAAGEVEGAATLDLNDNKKVKWDLTNNTYGDVFIESLTIDWPVQSGQELKKVKLDGDEFAKDVFDGTPPTNLPAEDPFEADINRRTLEIGATETLEIEFTQDRVSDSSYGIWVTFSNGDVVSISVP